jgi:wyosine [tRNA(Phe)-imidazoG37] synthetase (radical SAM superfamily)
MTQASFHAVVYGPIKTRRLGAALGINPVPSSRESCGPECVYCRTGLAESVPILARASQLPSAGVIVTCAARRIMGLSKAGEKLESVMVAGNLDPTKHPSLLTITENLRDLRNKWFPKADLCLYTDGANLEAADTRRAMQIYDQPIVRFEWGTPKTFAAMTGRPQTDLKVLTGHLGGLDRLILQATFVQGGPDNATDPEVKAWVKRVEELRPKEVVIQTIETPKARTAKPRPVPVARLEEIAAQLSEKTGVATSVAVEEAQPV